MRGWGRKRSQASRVLFSCWLVFVFTVVAVPVLVHRESVPLRSVGDVRNMICFSRVVSGSIIFDLLGFAHAVSCAVAKISRNTACKSVPVSQPGS